MSKYKVLEETTIETAEEKADKKELVEVQKTKKDKKEKKEKKGGLKAKTNETISELKKVTWPTFGEAIKKTGIVLIFVAISLVLLLLIDLLLGNLINLL